jgi:hypothetical protein
LRCVTCQSSGKSKDAADAMDVPTTIIAASNAKKGLLSRPPPRKRSECGRVSAGVEI